MVERVPGIYEYSLKSLVGGGINEIHIFLVPGGPGRRSLMVDAGFGEGHCLEETKRVMEGLGISFRDLDVFLTHEHYDHSGLAGMLERQGARIFMNPEENRHHYTCLCHRRSFDAMEEEISVLRTVGVTPERTPALWHRYSQAADQEIREEKGGSWVVGDFPYHPVHVGQVFSYGDYTLRAFPLRGHSAGQMGLYDDERRVVFLADQVLNGIVPIVSTSHPGERLLESFFLSLEQIKRQFQGWTVFSAHAAQIGELSAQVERIAISYLDKLDKISHVVNESSRPLTVYEAACLSYGIHKVPKSDGEFVQVKAIISKTFSCLEFLEEKGFIEKELHGGMLFWGKRGSLKKNRMETHDSEGKGIR